MQYKQILENWNRWLLTEGVEDLGLPQEIVDQIKGQCSDLDPSIRNKAETWVGNLIKKYPPPMFNGNPFISAGRDKYALDLFSRFKPYTKTLELQRLIREVLDVAATYLIGADAARAKTVLPNFLDSINSEFKKLESRFEREYDGWTGWLDYKSLKKIHKAYVSLFKKYVPKLMLDNGTEQRVVDAFLKHVSNNIMEIENIIEDVFLYEPLNNAFYRLSSVLEILEEDPSFFNELNEILRDTTENYKPEDVLSNFVNGAVSSYSARENPEQVYIDFGDGFYWYDTQVNSCEIEKREMHHCGAGNTGTSNLYSLRYREPGRPRGVKPDYFITVDFEERDKTILQIKGKKYEYGVVYGNRIPPQYVTIGDGDEKREYNLWDKVVDLVEKLDAVSIMETGEEGNEPDQAEALSEYIIDRVSGVVTFSGVNREALLQQAEAEAGDLQRRYDLTHTFIDIEIEDAEQAGFDEDNIYVAYGSFGTRFKFPFTVEWSRAERPEVPTGWRESQDFLGMIRSILENYNVYLGDDEGIYAEEDSDNKIFIVINDRTTSIDDLDEIETLFEQARSLDEKYDEIKNDIEAYLISEGYLPSKSANQISENRIRKGTFRFKIRRQK